ncbi:MAG: tRNA (adenosine(37)-N6)-threonylcarbamoyltransferase complex transferase subunit TsaD [Gammaproteobacteria bacterium]
MLVLGIETSCDETGVALYSPESGVVGQSLFSQVDLHRVYGGVVPELASRDHLKRLLPMVQVLCDEAGVTPAAITGVGYTAGPGLVGALFVGAMLARGLAYSWRVPSIGVHHMEGHLLAPFLDPHAMRDGLAYPFLGLLVSGGHCQLVQVDAPGEYRLLGETVDDAVGEAFDKVATVLGLPYPGGPALEHLAATTDEMANEAPYVFPRPMAEKATLNFSFSGLKTHVNQFVASKKAAGAWSEREAARVAFAFQEAATESLWIKCRKALKQTGLKRLVVAGGVSANRFLRRTIDVGAGRLGVRCFYPPPAYCTDNGAMIAYAAYCRFASGQQDQTLAVRVKARWSLQELPPMTIGR